MMAGILNKLHSTPPDQGAFSLASRVPASEYQKVAPLLDSVRPIIQSCKKNSSALAGIIPPNQFWRWKDMWSISLRNAIYSAALVEYVTTGTLISLEQVSATLGSESSSSDGNEFTHTMKYSQRCMERQVRINRRRLPSCPDHPCKRTSASHLSPCSAKILNQVVKTCRQFSHHGEFR